jgi:hypothetical protein
MQKAFALQVKTDQRIGFHGFKSVLFEFGGNDLGDDASIK